MPGGLPLVGRIAGFLVPALEHPVDFRHHLLHRIIQSQAKDFSLVVLYPSATSRIIITVNPIMAPVVAVSSKPARCDSGTTSSTTT